MYEKKANSLEEKIKMVIEESKKKDMFIQQSIIGKKISQEDKEFVMKFLKQYETCLDGRSLSEKINLESQEIDKLTAYNFTLLKEIAELKEKLLIYEAISADNGSELEILAFSPLRTLPP